MKPLLIFPKPHEKSRIRFKRFIPQPRTPGRINQQKRLDQSFKLIEKNFEKGAMSIDPAGFSPERMLVLETIGPVEKFYRAAKKIEGLDFIQELIGDEVEPDDDFYYVDVEGKKEDKSLKGYVYLAMSNQTALNKLLGYWNGYTKHKNYKFPWGLAPLKELFEHLYNIRYWDTEDRLRSTGIIEDWSYRIAEGQDSVPVEVEIWYRDSPDGRYASEKRISQLINALGGDIEQRSVVEEIQYHAVLGKIPIKSIDQLINKNDTNIELLRCDDVMYFRPTGQCMAPIFTAEDESQEFHADGISNDDEIIDSPTVALLDGLPLENHEWLKDYITIDDPDNWSDDYSPSDQRHGTSMASLIVRGDMEKESGPIPRKIYCRPILKPDLPDINGNRRERIPDGILPIDLIHRSIRRLFEPEGDNPPSAPSVKIINLSIADPNRLFDQQMSPWAKLLDFLSEKYQVLFVISAGNHFFDINLGISNREFNELSDDDKESVILKSIARGLQSRRLMSPAESVNAITVAGYHHDEHMDEEFYGQDNPYRDRMLPSTINPITWGKKRSVKPEILMPSGRATYRLKSVLDDDVAVLSILTYEGPPGHKVATPGKSGSLNSYAYTFGTSNSTALATRRLCFLNETIQDLYSSKYGEYLSSEYENVLLKALICHGASHEESVYKLENILKEPGNAQRFKAILAKYLGYGIVNEERIHGCLDNQATILQCGKIIQDTSHIYKFKLPKSLNAQSVKRRLIITLSWFTPINVKHQAYRQAHLYFEPATGNKEDNYLDIQNRELDWQMVRNGTVQHEVLSGDKAAVYADGTEMNIIIQCRSQAGAKDISVPYGLVVSLDTPDVELPIYEEIRESIEAQFQTQIEIEKQVIK